MVELDQLTEAVDHLVEELKLLVQLLHLALDVVVQGLLVLRVILAETGALHFLRQICHVGGGREVVRKHPETRRLSHLAKHVFLVGWWEQVVGVVLAITIVLSRLGLIFGVRLRVGRGLALGRLKELLQVNNLII